MKVEEAVLGSQSLNSPYGLRGRKATVNDLNSLPSFTPSVTVHELTLQHLTQPACAMTVPPSRLFGC